ncbi:hypothetical protein ES703_12706 [subsurface metagenome]
MAITITAAEIKEMERKYRLRFQPNSGRARAWAMFEQGVGPAVIAYQNLLPGLREVTIHSYYSEWGRSSQRVQQKEIFHTAAPNGERNQT